MPLITRRWTDEDIKRLTELSAQGATVLRAAAALRRQSSSVVKMARMHGLPLIGTRQAKANIRELDNFDTAKGQLRHS